MGILNKKVMGIAAAAMFASTSSWAVTFGDGGAALQGVLDGIATDGANDVSAATGEIGGGEYWAIDGSGGAISTIIIELAGNANSNTFGIYDAFTNQHVELFSGADTAGFANGGITSVSILLDGSVILDNVNDTGVDFAGNKFAFYLDTSDNGTF